MSARRFSGLLFLPAVTALACGGGSKGPSQPSGSITGVSGDGQGAPLGTELANPIGFVVLSGSGLPEPGRTVTWLVVTGTATVQPTSSTTDGTGSVSTRVTMGNQPGPIVVRGTVEGLSHVDFHLEAINPCAHVVPYVIGTSIDGALTTFDCAVGGYYYDFYGLTLASQQGLTVDMTASYDAYVELYSGTLAAPELVGFNDDANATTTNSHFAAIVSPGTYLLMPNSAFQLTTGTYTMTTTSRAQSLAGCEVVWGTRGLILNDSVTASDCPTDLQGGAGYGDGLAIFVRANTALKVSLQSDAFDPALKVYAPTSTGFQLVAANSDSSPGTTTAYVAYQQVSTAVFVVFAGAETPGDTGPYTLRVWSSTTYPVAQEIAPHSAFLRRKRLIPK